MSSYYCWVMSPFVLFCRKHIVSLLIVINVIHFLKHRLFYFLLFPTCSSTRFKLEKASTRSLPEIVLQCIIWCPHVFFIIINRELLQKLWEAQIGVYLKVPPQPTNFEPPKFSTFVPPQSIIFVPPQSSTFELTEPSILHLRSPVLFVPPQSSTFVPPQSSTFVPPQFSTFVPPQISTFVPPQISTFVPQQFSTFVPELPKYPCLVREMQCLASWRLP